MASEPGLAEKYHGGRARGALLDRPLLQASAGISRLPFMGMGGGSLGGAAGLPGGRLGGKMQRQDLRPAGIRWQGGAFISSQANQPISFRALRA